MVESYLQTIVGISQRTGSHIINLRYSLAPFVATICLHRAASVCLGWDRIRGWRSILDRLSLVQLRYLKRMQYNLTKELYKKELYKKELYKKELYKQAVNLCV